MREGFFTDAVVFGLCVGSVGQQLLYCLRVAPCAGKDEGRPAVLIDHPVHTTPIN